MMRRTLFAVVLATFLVSTAQVGSAQVGQPQNGQSAVAVEQQTVIPKRHVAHYRPKPFASALHPIQQRLIRQTNAARAQYGLPPLSTDMSLVKSAQHHTAWMTNSRSLQHSHAQVAENIAMGQGSVAEVINSWMNSPGHRANMLNGRYQRLGVAAYRTPEGTIYWCQQFAW